ncbi:hypothetical protein CC86DRAFT_413663 [Ophiobolus disseminans]|uniref:Uncharacterized protein n=1 Tax=Ophiobolus disseminans TaxID=1469910 RepID=A0A6A6ZF14_9PLEO|nr:hypothetical protein CC86DRAFT_413663 [Ophiobolus disseminans]
MEHHDGPEEHLRPSHSTKRPLQGLPAVGGEERERDHSAQTQEREQGYLQAPDNISFAETSDETGREHTSIKRKRSQGQLSLRSPSPPRSRVKVEEQDEASSLQSITRRDRATPFHGMADAFRSSVTPEEQGFDSSGSRVAGSIPYDHFDARGCGRGNDPATLSSANFKVLIVDLYDEDNIWQILCQGTHLGRQKVASYLGFSNTKELCDWEEKYEKRWRFIQEWSRRTVIGLQVQHILRIICNNGGEEAKVLEWLEHYKQWECPLDDDYNRNIQWCASSMHLNEHVADGVLRKCAIIVWLIKTCRNQFTESGKFGTPRSTSQNERVQCSL